MSNCEGGGKKRRVAQIKRKTGSWRRALETGGGVKKEGGGKNGQRPKSPTVAREGLGRPGGYTPNKKNPCFIFLKRNGGEKKERAKKPLD